MERDNSGLIELIEKYYDDRNLKYPNVWQSLGWANTELAEVYELLLARDGGWVRNNPQNHEEFSKERLSEEIGDTIMMLMVAGYVEGVNPIQSLKDKIQRKLEKLQDEELEELMDEDNYDYAQDDLNFDAARERRFR